MISRRGALRGARKPRVCSVPSYRSSAGSEAVDLAKSAGLILDPWQQDVLTASLGERHDGKWSAFEVGLIVPRQNGKGAILEARELFGLVLAEEELILHSAHLFKTSKDAFRRVLSLFQNTPDLDRKIKSVSNTHGLEGIELVNGCRLYFVARSKGGGRGLSGDCLILDEAYAVTDDQVDALMPTMSARPNGQIWYTSSPPLDSATGEPLFAMKARGEAEDEQLAWFDWGAEDGADLDDRKTWAATNPALGIRITEETIARERKTMKPKGFGRERLGIWPESAGLRVISAELWLELAVPRPDRPSEVAFAVDVTPMRDHAAITFAGLGPSGHMLVAVVDHREGTDWIVERLSELKDRWNPVAIALDEKSPAGSLLTDLEKVGITRPTDKAKPKRSDLAIPTGQEIGASFGMLVDAAKQKRLRHGDDAPLNTAIAGARTRSLGVDGTAWARKGNTDICPLVSATLANWAFETRAHLVADDYDPQVLWA